MFPKREFTLALSETYQKQAISGGSSLAEIPRGTLVSSLVSIRMDRELLEGKSTKDKYVPATQEYFAWFAKVDGGTQMTVLTRVDLGIDIPRYVFRLS